MCHSLLAADPVKLRLPLMSNGLRVFETTLVGETVIAALDASAKGALKFVGRSSVVPGVFASNGIAGGTNAGGYNAMPVTTRKFVIMPLSAARHVEE